MMIADSHESSSEDEPEGKVSLPLNRSNELEVFHCPKCSTKFAGQTVFKKHLGKHAKTNVFCRVCGKTCPDWVISYPTNQELYHDQLLQIYRYKCNKADLFQCKECKEAFLNRSLLKFLMVCTSRQLVVDKHFKCPICHKLFNQKCILMIHLRIHTGEKPYQCEHCLKRFYTRIELDVHVKESHFSETLSFHQSQSSCKDFKLVYQCPNCNVKYDCPYAYEHHLLQHVGKNINCPICSSQFSDVGTLATHMRTHLSHSALLFKKTLSQSSASSKNVEIFQCPMCNIKFAGRKVYDRHLRKHSGKTHDCPICGRGFQEDGVLARHLKTHSGERDPFKCTYCNKSCLNPTSLKIHLTVHSIQSGMMKPFHCLQCDQSFEQIDSLGEHLKMHTIEKKCNRNFTSAAQLEKHNCVQNSVLLGDSTTQDVLQTNNISRHIPIECEMEEEIIELNDSS